MSDPLLPTFLRIRLPPRQSWSQSPLLDRPRYVYFSQAPLWLINRHQELLGHEELEAAVASGNYNAVVNVVSKYRTELKEPTTLWFNVAIAALLKTYTGQSSIAPIIATYHAMIESNVLPNIRTYNLMIHALCMRDTEIQYQIAAVGARMRRRDLQVPPSSSPDPSYYQESASRNRESDSRLLVSLKEESNFNSALVLFQAACKIATKVPLDRRTYSMLLHACSSHKAVDAAIRVFAHYERYSKDPATPWMYQELITVHGAVRDGAGAQEVFEEFRNQSAAK